MNQKDKKISKVITGLFIFLFLIVGILTSVSGIRRFENYDQPYLFGLIFSVLGLLTGIVFSSKVKSRITFNKGQLNNYWLPRLFISVGFIGVFLLTGTLANNALSKVDSCDNYSLIGKEKTMKQFRTPDINYLLVNYNGETKKLICSPDYWDTLTTGQTINICYFKSPLVFNYLELTKDTEETASR